VPNQLITIEELEEAKQVMKFIEMMEELDDVQNVFSNFEISEDLVGELES
jgi:transcriptional/translational regulatory protein YebC/TACO1